LTTGREQAVTSGWLLGGLPGGRQQVQLSRVNPRHDRSLP